MTDPEKSRRIVLGVEDLPPAQADWAAEKARAARLDRGVAGGAVVLMGLIALGNWLLPNLPGHHVDDVVPSGTQTPSVTQQVPSVSELKSGDSVQVTPQAETSQSPLSGTAH